MLYKEGAQFVYISALLSDTIKISSRENKADSAKFMLNQITRLHNIATGATKISHHAKHTQ